LPRLAAAFFLLIILQTSSPDIYGNVHEIIATSALSVNSSSMATILRLATATFFM
jgi:hypothetical protein